MNPTPVGETRRPPARPSGPAPAPSPTPASAVPPALAARQTPASAIRPTSAGTKWHEQHPGLFRVGVLASTSSAAWAFAVFGPVGLVATGVVLGGGAYLAKKKGPGRNTGSGLLSRSTTGARPSMWRGPGGTGRTTGLFNRPSSISKPAGLSGLRRPTSSAPTTLGRRPSAVNPFRFPSRQTPSTIRTTPSSPSPRARVKRGPADRAGIDQVKANRRRSPVTRSESAADAAVSYFAEGELREAFKALMVSIVQAFLFPFLGDRVYAAVPQDENADTGKDDGKKDEQETAATSDAATKEQAEKRKPTPRRIRQGSRSRDDVPTRVREAVPERERPAPRSYIVEPDLVDAEPGEVDTTVTTPATDTVESVDLDLVDTEIDTDLGHVSPPPRGVSMPSQPTAARLDIRMPTSPHRVHEPMLTNHERVFTATAEGVLNMKAHLEALPGFYRDWATLIMVQAKNYVSWFPIVPYLAEYMTDVAKAFENNVAVATAIAATYNTVNADEIARHVRPRHNESWNDVPDGAFKGADMHTVRTNAMHSILLGYQYAPTDPVDMLNYLGGFMHTLSKMGEHVVHAWRTNPFPGSGERELGDQWKLLASCYAHAAKSSFEVAAKYVDSAAQTLHNHLHQDEFTHLTNIKVRQG